MRPMESSRRILSLLLLSFLYAHNTNAQQDSVKGKNYSINFQVFAKAGFYHEASKPLTEKYDLNRTLIVYNQHFFKRWNFCLAGDTYVKDNNEIYQRTPYIKRAYLQYQQQGLSLLAGLLVSEQFKYPRKIWQLRYVSKTFQNYFDYGENRNIGILLKHTVAERFWYDIAFTSGYYTPIKDSSKKYQFMTGQTLQTVFCTIRLFNCISLNTNHEHILSLFLSKQIKEARFGIEAAKKSSHNNPESQDQIGFSVFGNYLRFKNILLFTRYDLNKKSINTQPQKVLWAGIQYSIKKHLNASIFYKNENPDTNFYGLALFLH